MQEFQNLPNDVKKTLSYLAHLLDDTIELRRSDLSPREFAAKQLQVPTSQIVAASGEVSSLAFQLVAYALSKEIAAFKNQVEIVAFEEDEPPKWTQLVLEDRTESIPSSLCAFFPAGTVASIALIVALHSDDYYTVLDIYSSLEDQEKAESYLTKLLKKARSEDNPFKNKAIEVKATDAGLVFNSVKVEQKTRQQIILEEKIYQVIDENVFGLINNLETLKKAKLGTNRGILLAGPPGTGKTALSKVLATELAGQVTIIFCSASVVANAVKSLYREAAHLAPALIVMEDVDLVIGHRNMGASASLLEFLTTLDGALSAHEGIITLATTNDLKAIDPAAIRTSRFDVIEEVHPPKVEARIAILKSYLEPLEITDDPTTIAEKTEGASGSDLRELISMGVLKHGPNLSIKDLQAIATKIAETRNWKTTKVNSGQYL